MATRSNIASRLMHFLTVCSLLLATGAFATPSVAAGPADVSAPHGAVINSIFVNTPPQLNGSLAHGEWNYSTKLTLPHGFISVVNDSTRLYLLIDMTAQTINDSGDYFRVTFDTNRNGIIDPGTLNSPGVDMNYGYNSGTRNMRYQYYLSAGTWTGTYSSTYSAESIGYGCYVADGSLVFTSYFLRGYTCTRHRIWELGFDLAEIGASAGGTAKIGVRAASPASSFTDELPTGFAGDFSNLVTVNLAASSTYSIAPYAGAHVAFQANPIEVTQAVQHVDNSLPLVANKDTVARVYTITSGAIAGESAHTYLYGSVGSDDLPGSPLVVTQTAPTTINRLTLTNTANFKLPASWTAAATVTFSAKAVGHNGSGDKASTTSQALSFNTRDTLVVWIVPVNRGTTATPVVPPQSEIDSQMSYMRALYPLADITFVQKPWTVLGVVTGDPIPALNTYYNNVVLAYIITLILGGTPFTLPDQIYGFTPSGGGSSNPVWVGGAGHVAYGYRGTSREGTMAHEINHNLDRDPSGTWGHHIVHGGCGASGDDPSWPYADAATHEVGFDTRTPWNGSGSPYTVVPATFPDIMSYCQSVGLPTKWISDYRWNALYGNFVPPADAPQAFADPAGAPTLHYYVSGSITRDPVTQALSGTLNPALYQQGYDDMPAQTNNPNFAIYIYGSAQDMLLRVVPFTATFIPDPEEPVNTMYFNFSIPYVQAVTGGPEKITRIILNPYSLPADQSPQVIVPMAQIVVPATVPTLSITSPASAGITWSGSHSLTWAPSNSAAVDTFSVFFSKDNGASWTELATNLAGATSLEIDTATLPNTTAAKFRVTGTDGFNTFSAESPVITILNSSTKPSVHIVSPVGSPAMLYSGQVTLEGQGQDATDGALTDDQLFWLEGGSLLGSGASLPVTLGPGLHTLTLKGVNTQGAENTADVALWVQINPVFVPRIMR